MVKTADAEKSLHKVTNKTETFGTKLKKGIGTAAKWGAAIGAAAVAVGTAVYKMANKAAEAGDKIDKGSQRMNVSAKQYQTLGLAAEHCGTSMTTMSKAGIKAMDAGYDSIYDYLEQLKQVPDSAERMAQAQEVLGTKTAQSLAPFINGKETLSDYEKELESTGYMSEDAVKASAKFQDTLTTLKTTAKNVGLSLSGNFIPIVTKIMQFAIDHAPEVKKALSMISGYIKKGIEWIESYWNKHGNTIMKAVKTVLNIIKTSVKAVMSVIGGIMSTVTAAMEGDWSGFAEGVKGILKTLKKYMSTIGKQIINALLGAFKSVFPNVTDWVTEKVNWFKDKFNKVKEFVKGIAGAEDGQTDGHHASGLPYVPYDGYKAVLHKGEAVVPARQNGNTNGNSNVSINFNGSYTLMNKDQIDYLTRQQEKMLRRQEAFV